MDAVTAQPTLFDEQQVQLSRVTGMIGRAILTFLRNRFRLGAVEFHADELREAVAASCQSAPASADRVLRDLRKAGVVSYVVVNRRASLYRLVSVR